MQRSWLVENHMGMLTSALRLNHWAKVQDPEEIDSGNMITKNRSKAMRWTSNDCGRSNRESVSVLSKVNPHALL